MHWLTNWFSKRPQTARPVRPARRARLEVEGLENRLVPTVSFGGGNVLTHVEVQPLFLGADWATDPTLKAQATQIENYLQYVVNSPYMDMLTAAGYHDAAGNLVGRGTFTAAPPADQMPIDKSLFLTDDQINTELNKKIGDGTLAANDANRLYIVFTEPGVAVSTPTGTSTTNFSGYHSGRYTLDGQGNMTSSVNYAVIPYPGGSVGNLKNPGLTDFQSMTEITSHELAEAVTDPVGPKTGWTDPTRGDDNEIADIVERMPDRTVFLNGYAVQKVADQNDNPIAPAGSTSTPPAGASALPGLGTSLQQIGRPLALDGRALTGAPNGLTFTLGANGQLGGPVGAGQPGQVAAAKAVSAGTDNTPAAAFASDRLAQDTFGRLPAQTGGATGFQTVSSPVPTVAKADRNADPAPSGLSQQLRAHDLAFTTGDLFHDGLPVDTLLAAGLGTGTRS